MVRDDQDWQNLVRNIANDSANTPDCVQAAEDYLWDAANWERLKYTPHGRFLREVVNPVPDMTLLSVYCKQVLAA